MTIRTGRPESAAPTKFEKVPAVVYVTRDHSIDDNLILHHDNDAVDSFGFKKTFLFGNDEGQTRGAGPRRHAKCNGGHLGTNSAGGEKVRKDCSEQYGRFEFSHNCLQRVHGCIALLP
jgi:hypothetical protein